MKMYPDPWDTFKFKQGHVIANQPIRIVFRARETADVSFIFTETRKNSKVRSLVSINREKLSNHHANRMGNSGHLT